VTALGPSQPDRPFHGLWSLWDMLRIFGKPFVDATSLIGQLIAWVQTQKFSSFNDKGKKEITDVLDKLIDQAKALGLPLTTISADRLRSEINKQNSNRAILRHAMVELQYRLTDEIDSTYLLSLSQRERDLYEPTLPLWGMEVSLQFPSIAYEIDEAAKCIALRRATASAFHSIRSLEAAIRAMSRCLGIPDPTRASGRNWGNLLKAIKTEIDVRWPNTTDRLLGDGRMFEETYGALAGMQNPYRNATMHLDHKYTEDEAQNLFEIVKGFMNRIADRMDENGDPKA
jgi:hypothetical protein